MGYITFISAGELSVIGFWGLKPQGVFFLFAIVLLIATLISIYFIIVHYRKELELKRNDLRMQIDKLKLQKETLSNELDAIKEEFIKIQKERSEWEGEKERFALEIKDLKEQIQQLKKNEPITNNDIIIEYYMRNGNSN